MSMPNLKFDNFRHIYSYIETIYNSAHVLEVNVKLVADCNRVSGVGSSTSTKKVRKHFKGELISPVNDWL